MTIRRFISRKLIELAHILSPPDRPTRVVVSTLSATADSSIKVGEAVKVVPRKYTVQEVVDKPENLVYAGMGNVLFTFDTLKQILTNLGKVRVTHIVLSKKALADMNMDQNFDNYFDPVSKLSEIQQGHAGTLLGMEVLTDSHFPKPLTNYKFALYAMKDDF